MKTYWCCSRRFISLVESYVELQLLLFSLKFDLPDKTKPKPKYNFKFMPEPNRTCWYTRVWVGYPPSIWNVELNLTRGGQVRLETNLSRTLLSDHLWNFLWNNIMNGCVIYGQ